MRQDSLAIDTNVPKVANGRSPNASDACVQACHDGLRRVTTGDARLLLDSGFEIFEEYRSNLSLSGEPGLGDAFMLWVHDRQFDPKYCQRVELTRHPTRRFEEFPEDPRLAGFDPSDRKFASVVRASKANSSVLNAVDPDWWLFRDALAENGVRVEFLCSDQVEAWRRQDQ